MHQERSPLIENRPAKKHGLSLLFAIICILDVFGVFPVITLPKAIINCGFYGIIVIAIVCSAQMYTAALLGSCWVMAEKIHPAIRKKNRYPYAALAEITCGRRLASCVTFLLDLTIFCGGIPNLIVASQNLQLLGLRISDNILNISYCYWILIVGTVLCPILWLGSPKDMKYLCSISVCIVVLFLLTCGCLLYSDGSKLPPEEALHTEDVALWQSILQAYGIIVFLFDIHPSILTIQVDMNDKSQLSVALVGGFAATLTMFGVTTMITAWKYGMATQTSILETLPTSIPLHLAAILVAIQLCLTSAVSNNALYQQMEDFMNISRDFNRKRCVLRTTLTVLAMVLAESVPRFDLVMSLIGGTLTGPLVFILPPIIYLNMLSLQKKHQEEIAIESFTNIVYTNEKPSASVSNYIERNFKEDLKSSWDLSATYWDKINTRYLEIGICLLILISSIVLTVGTTYMNVTTAILSYSNFTKPCIYNISVALLYL